MARRKTNVTAPTPGDQVTDYRHADKRKHIPPAGLAAQGRVQEVPKTRYAYDPHLPPVLRFDDDRRSRPAARTAGDRARARADRRARRSCWPRRCASVSRGWSGPASGRRSGSTSTPSRCTSTSASRRRRSSSWRCASRRSGRSSPTRSWSTARPCASTSTTWTGPTG